MAYTDTVLATTPIRYWPLNETSGTTANELVAAANGTASGLTMGNANGPTGGTLTDTGGIGGKAVAFTGTEHIVLASDKILGGKDEWTASGWVYTALADSNEHVFYGEMSTSAGNDQIRVGMKGPAGGPLMSHTYGNDPSIITKTSSSVFIQGYWSLVHYMWRVGGNVEMWWNGAQRAVLTGSSSGTAWTNASLATWIGGPPRSGQGTGWVGRVAHVFLHDRKLTGPEMGSLYRAGTPLQRPLFSKTPLFASTAIWNQDLTDPANPPTIATDSASTVSALVAQVSTWGSALSAGGGPIFEVTNAQATERVRNRGGANDATLHTQLANVPVPSNFTGGIGGDSEATIHNSDTDEAWEFWRLGHTLIEPDYVTGAVQTGGTIPVSATPYAYVVYPADASHGIGTGKSVAVTVTAGNQQVAVSWGISDGATYYRIYRRLNTAGSSGGLFMIEVSAATHTWTDNGSITPGAPSSAAPAAVMTDWACAYGGYIANIAAGPGHYVSPDQLYGASATSLPLYAGVTTILEGYDTGEIPHALTMAAQETAATFVYPAQRCDTWTGPNPQIREGTRFQLDPTYDVTQITNPFVRRMAVAMQKYGVYVRDHGGNVVVYIEAADKIGRDPWPEILAGKYGYEVLAGFPWSRLRVIDPVWTLTNVTPTPEVTGSIDELIDDFSGTVVNTAKWTAAGSPAPSQTGGQLHIPTHGSPYAKLTTATGPYSLVGSAVYWNMRQRPMGNAADQSGITIACTIDSTNAILQFWVDSGGGFKAAYVTPTQARVNLSPTPDWDPVAHAWQRIREQDGTIYFEVAADGGAWQPFAQVDWATTGWPDNALLAVNVVLFSGNYLSVAGRPDMILESLNVVEAAAPIEGLPDTPTNRGRVGPLLFDFAGLTDGQTMVYSERGGGFRPS